ncbi:DUF4091 domain-containing protein (plasmid) [Pedobacter sp. BS3]|uniref:glycoside hydrolase domain-containing protein n=1 Tax=Pedobacter sp. BS3 TaxID=2567937 RepID=UPI0011EC7DA1|nr:glycoside hydrolase domain-containing protein [Pedobacter sp. BS3]TZF86375.1 DUF4091 domain-containing protein [Pedobacter sp. BS3]
MNGIRRMIALLALLSAYTISAEAEELYKAFPIKKEANTGNDFQCKLLDLYARIYSDNFPVTEPGYQSVNIPRNYTLGMQLAITGSSTQQFTIVLDSVKNEEGTSFTGGFAFRRLLPVHVEGNTQGSMINVPGGAFPDSWVPYLVRLAPFDVLEAVADTQTTAINVPAEEIAGVLLQIQVPTDCPIGHYQGNIKITGSLGIEKNIPVSFTVHKTVLPEDYFLDSTHWLSELPENLKSGTSVEWWSEAHWNLLERAGKMLREDGANTMFTPLVSTAHPLIQTLWNSQTKTLSFDYSRFDRWVHMFDSLGFKYFAGRHMKLMGSGLTIKDSVTGNTISLGSTQINFECFQQTFLKDLNNHLQTLGMLNRYVQHIYDEPSPAALNEYKHYNNILKRTMPTVKSIDANSSHPELFTDMIGIQVFNLPGIILQKNDAVKDRLSQHKSIWLYNTSSPYPPYPNRHLDQPLIENRLWPWLCMKYNASGYLFWAANEYRGVPDEYQTSLGPLPNGSQNPGHPPGDAWLYYRSPNGLIPSMRIISFREGMVDATLLAKLRSANPSKAQELIAKLVFPEIEQGQDLPFSTYLTRAETIPKGYEDSPATFNAVRKEMLDYLDTIY